MNAIHPPSPPRLHGTLRGIFRPSPVAGAIIFSAFLAIWPIAGMARPQPDNPPGTPPGTTQNEPEQPIEPPTDPVERALNALSNSEPGAETEVDRLLRSPETALKAVSALASLERISPSLWRAVSVLTTPDQPEAQRLCAVRALPRFGTRDAAVRLLTLLDDSSSMIREAARLALADMTGLDSTWDEAQWRAWGDQASAWSDRAWASVIMTRQNARVRALTDRQRALGDEVVNLYRRLHVELDAPGRTALLAELIRDDRNPLRDLGFELAGRDLSARTQLGPEVAIAAVARLTHADPATRAKAATLVGRLVPPDAMMAITRALVSETTAVAAEPMLLGVARWPSDDAVMPTVRWLARDDAPVGAVTTALWSLAQAGFLDDPPLRERVLAGLRERDLVRTGEPGMKLFVRFGNTQDLAAIAEQLTLGDDPARNAAANALAETPVGAALLLEAATGDPRLFPPAARAIGLHMPNAEGLKKTAGLPAIESTVKTNAILEVARMIPPDQLGRAVRSAALSAPMCERALGRLLDPEIDRTPGVFEGLILLADARLKSAKPALAAELLASLDITTAPPESRSEMRRLELRARLALHDLEAAKGIGATLPEWVEAWRTLDPAAPVRSPAASFILEHFAAQITDELKTEFATVAPTPSAPQPPKPDTGVAGDPEPSVQGGADGRITPEPVSGP